MLPPAVLFTEDGYMHRILRRRKEARVLLIKGDTYLARGHSAGGGRKVFFAHHK